MRSPKVFEGGSTKYPLVRRVRARVPFLRMGLVCLVALLACLVDAGSSSASGRSVHGGVVDASGASVGNVRIEARSQAGPVVTTTTTAADGTFTLPVPDGVYSFVLTPPSGSGFRETRLDAIAVASTQPARLVLLSGNPVTVSGRAGTVVDGVFRPASCCVSIGFDPKTEGVAPTSARVDANGTFTASVIAGATYVVSGGSGFSFASAQAFAGGEVLDLAVPTSRVTFVVDDPAGRPVPGASISATASTVGSGQRVETGSSDVDSGRTDSTGTVVAHIPTGARLTDVTLLLANGIQVAEALPDITGDVTIPIAAPATATVTGRVGFQVDGAFRSSSGGNVDFDPDGSAVRPTAALVDPTTGAFSATVATGIPYLLSGALTSGPPGAASTSFSVPASETFAGGEALDLAVPTSRVTLVVHDDAGRPVSGASIFTAADSRGSGQPVEVDSSGGYSGLTDATGTIVVQVPTGARLPNSRLRLANGVEVATNLPNIKGDTTIALTAPTTMTVSGRAGFLVDGTFQRGDGFVVFDSQDPGYSDATARVDASGNFSVILVRGKRYGVYGALGGSDLDTSFSFGSARTFADGEVLDLAVSTSRVTFVVRDRAGRPVSGVRIGTTSDARDPGRAMQAYNAFSSAFTDATGVAVVEVPTGARFSSATLAAPAGTQVNLRLDDVLGDEMLVIDYDHIAGSATVARPTATVALAVSRGASATEPVTLSATVRGGLDPAHAPPGTVQFSFVLNGGPPQAIGDPVPVGVGGVATLELPGGLPHAGSGPSTYSLTAAFTPSQSGLSTTGTSAPVQFTLDGVLSSFVTGACVEPAAQCSDPQTFRVAVDPGALLISTPHSAGHPFDLGHLALAPSGLFFHAAAEFGTAADPAGGVTVTDARAGDLPWSASASVGDFVSGPNRINGQNLGLTSVTARYVDGNAINAATNPVVTNDIPGGGPGTIYGPDDPGTQGLKATAPGRTFATVAHGTGSVNITGTLDLYAPTSTPAGMYTTVITFTIA